MENNNEPQGAMALNKASAQETQTILDMIDNLGDYDFEAKNNYLLSIKRKMEQGKPAELAVIETVWFED